MKRALLILLSVVAISLVSCDAGAPPQGTLARDDTTLHRVSVDSATGIVCYAYVTAVSCAYSPRLMADIDSARKTK